MRESIDIKDSHKQNNTKKEWSVPRVIYQGGVASISLHLRQITVIEDCAPPAQAAQLRNSAPGLT